MWPLKQTVKRREGHFCKLDSIMQLFIFNQASVVSLLHVIQLQQAGCVLFFMILGLFQRVVIPLLVTWEGRHRARSRGTGTRADGEEGCPGGSDLLELRANGLHQSLSSLNTLKGEEMECAVYRSNTQDRLRRTGVRANKL